MRKKRKSHVHEWKEIWPGMYRRCLTCTARDFYYQCSARWIRSRPGRTYGSGEYRGNHMVETGGVYTWGGKEYRSIIRDDIHERAAEKHGGPANAPVV